MTARRAIAMDGTVWRFAPDDPPPLAGRSQIILRARLLDETTGEPPDAPPRVTTSIRGAWPVAAQGGLVGLAGRPFALFPPAGIAAAHVAIDASVEGFLPVRLEHDLGAQLGYPDAFTAIDLGDVALRRLPVVIHGRAVSRSAGALNGATVTVTGFWARLDQIAGAPAAPNLAGFWGGLHGDAPAGNVRARNLTPGAPAQTLLRPAEQGQTRIRLSDRQGLAANDILIIEPGDVERTEYIVITNVDLASSADQPAWIVLSQALRRDHPEDAVIVRAVPSAAGVDNALTRPARAGDVTGFTAALAGIGAATTHIETDSGAPPENHNAFGRYQTQSNATGDYRLPSIHRVAAVALRATHPISVNPIDLTVVPPLGAEEMSADFVFP